MEDSTQEAPHARCTTASTAAIFPPSTTRAQRKPSSNVKKEASHHQASPTKHHHQLRAPPTTSSTTTRSDTTRHSLKQPFPAPTSAYIKTVAKSMSSKTTLFYSTTRSAVAKSMHYLPGRNHHQLSNHHLQHHHPLL
jgi:BRCT domain type II-containing protein